MNLNPTLQKLNDLIQTKVDQLANDFGNVGLRTSIFREQVVLTGSILNINNEQAGNVVKAATAGYIMKAGGDPKAVLDALSADEQKILNYSTNEPTIFGVDLVTANKIAGFLAGGSFLFFIGGLASTIVALLTLGPEAFLAGTIGEGLMATLGNAFKIPQLRRSIILFALSGTLEALAMVTPMLTKQMVDNGSIGPGLRISAIKDAEDMKAKMTGTASPGSFTGSQFSDYAASLEVVGITTINDPAKGAPVPYSRQNLADLVKYVYGKQATTGGKTTVTHLIPLLAEYLVIGSGTPPTIQKTAPTSSSGGGAVAPQVTIKSGNKVFAGIVSQGVVGAGMTFTPRPDDLITSIEELKTAAQNNLSAFLASIFGKIVYEVKIVSSVVSKDGFTQRGTTQRVQTGTFANGTPKFKTVQNKFAEVVVYAITDKNTRSKLTTIVLGPTDSAALTIGTNDLTALETELPSLVTTTDINDINGIQSPNPINVTDQNGNQQPLPTPPPAPTTTPPPAPVPTIPKGIVQKQVGVTLSASEKLKYKETPISLASVSEESKYLDKGYLIKEYIPVPGILWIRAFEPLTTVSTALPPVNKPGDNATTLSAWYTARGMQLPSMAMRANLYASFGLGQASYYTGTAEQNIALLAKLKTT